MSAKCKWCGDSKTHDDIRCLREEGDALKGYFREAVDALGVYLQSGGKYAHLMQPGQSITGVGPGRLVAHFERWIADLQSGLYINCVYCGHRYGPSATTPATLKEASPPMAEVLKEHIKTCPRHPMSVLRAFLGRVVAAGDRMAHHIDCLASPENGGRGLCVCYKAQLSDVLKEAYRVLA